MSAPPTSAPPTSDGRPAWHAALLRLAAGVALAAAVWSVPTAAFAHGEGHQGLGLPTWLLVVASAITMGVWFSALANTWPSSHLDGFPSAVLPRPVQRGARVLAWPVRVLGLLAAVLAFSVALFGSALERLNLAPYTLLLLWIVGIVASGLLGDVWRLLSPFESVARLVPGSGGPRADPALTPDPLDDSLPARLGAWPAAVMLLVGAWLELVFPSGTSPRVLAGMILVYVTVMGIGAAWWGRVWIERAEFFGVLFRALALMAPLHRGDDGRLRVRAPLVGLARAPEVRGTWAVVLAALGALTFAEITHSALWQGYVIGPRIGWATVPAGTVGLILAVGLVGGVYLWAARTVRARVGAAAGSSLAEAPDQFAGAVVPVVVAYALAFNLPTVLLQFQELVVLASDPLQRDWNLFGTGTWTVPPAFFSAGLLATVQLLTLTCGHLAGLLVFHDRALAHCPEGLSPQKRSAILIVILVYALVGVLLL